MDDQGSDAQSNSSAVRAFEELRHEVSLLRRAIEGLTAERRDQNYGPTLEAIAASSEDILNWARNISEQPALRLTPQLLCDQIKVAASRFREQDRQMLEAARGHLATAIEELNAISAATRTRYEQARWVKIVGGVSFLGGFVLSLLLLQGAGISLN